MKQSGETSKICSINNYRNAYLFIYLCMYVCIYFSSTLFLLAYVNCILVKKLIKEYIYIKKNPVST